MDDMDFHERYDPFQRSPEQKAQNKRRRYRRRLVKYLTASVVLLASLILISLI